jgi:RsiW-degrading membrane proteinase PrsW (M82 family)
MYVNGQIFTYWFNFPRIIQALWNCFQKSIRPQITLIFSDSVMFMEILFPGVSCEKKIDMKYCRLVLDQDSLFDVLGIETNEA